MIVELQYGTSTLPVELPEARTDVLAPRFLPGLEDERESFLRAARAPSSGPPLAKLLSAEDTLAIVVADGTRPLPSDRILPWLLAELGGPEPSRVVIVVGTGSHRGNTPEQLRRLLGSEITDAYRVVNHDAYDRATLAPVGAVEGHEVLLNRHYVAAHRRIVVGFIEPHLMAGFSGGHKGIFPGIADIDSIMRYHRASVVGSPRSTWGRLEGNPTAQIVDSHGSLLAADFCVNVSLNRDRQITGVFAGEVRAAHRAGCDFVREFSMVPCPRPYPLVVTTNGGYPLDQNLYQGVKGMSAAAQVAAPGGSILAAVQCSAGFPANGNFQRLLQGYESPRQLLEAICAPGFSQHDQWQAQLLAAICAEHRVALFSELNPEAVRQAHLEPVADPQAWLDDELARLGPGGRIAVLPEGPMTIPYLAAAEP